jgi:hypothetical protein
MRKRLHILRLGGRLCLFAIVAAVVVVSPAAHATDDPLDALLERTTRQVASFLEVMSETNCTERVVQEKVAPDGKIIEKEASAYDYLIMISTEGGDLNLVESRLAAGDAKQHKKPRAPLLISNGFSTLFLVFHPYYASAFQFSREGEESIDGRMLAKIHFQHIPGMRSPAALALRGREYPLDFQGTAFVDASTGVIHRLTASIDSGMEDVGLKSLRSEVKFGSVTFHDPPESFWLPAEVIVEVETRHQHWRNTHEFSSYRRFAVNTKEQVAKQ